MINIYPVHKEIEMPLGRYVAVDSALWPEIIEIPGVKEVLDKHSGFLIEVEYE